MYVYMYVCKVDPRLGWWLMELPCSTFFPWFFLRTARSHEFVPRLFACIFMMHYLYRGWIFPCLIRVHGKSTNFSLVPVRITRKVVFENKTGEKVPDDNVNKAWDICNNCNGRGNIMKIHQLKPGMIQQIQMNCPNCNRTGSIFKNEYEIKNTSEILEVFIEKVSVNKDRIVFKNKGHWGLDGNYFTRLLQCKMVW